MILQKLGQEIINGPVDTLDIFSLTVRTIIGESKEESADGIVNTIYPSLLKGIETGDASRKVECLDICTELFKRFGLFILRSANIINKEQLMNAINKQL